MLELGFRSEIKGIWHNIHIGCTHTFLNSAKLTVIHTQISILHPLGGGAPGFLICPWYSHLFRSFQNCSMPTKGHLILPQESCSFCFEQTFHKAVTGALNRLEWDLYKKTCHINFFFFCLLANQLFCKTKILSVADCGQKVTFLVCEKLTVIILTSLAATAV